MSEMSKCNTAQLEALPPSMCYIALFFTADTDNSSESCIRAAKALKREMRHAQGVYRMECKHAWHFFKNFVLELQRFAVFVHI